MSPHAPKIRNNDLPFALVKGMEEGIECPRFEKRLIAEGNENSFTSGIHGPKALMDGGAHSPFIIRIENDFYLFGCACTLLLKLPFHSFVPGIEDDNDLLHCGPEERIETMFKHSLSSPREGQFIHLHPFRLSRTQENGRNHYFPPFSLKL